MPVLKRLVKKLLHALIGDVESRPNPLPERRDDPFRYDR
jgi:hypothetical protein